MLSNYTIGVILAAGCRYSMRNVETARKRSRWDEKDTSIAMRSMKKHDKTDRRVKLMGKQPKENVPLHRHIIENAIELCVRHSNNWNEWEEQCRGKEG